MAEHSLRIALLLNRLSLGLYFMIAGVGKFTGGVGEFVAGPFAAMKPDWLGDWFATPFGYALPFVEVAAAALLIVGLFGRAAAGLMALLLISFMIVGGIDHAHLPFNPNVILATVALLLAVIGPGRISLDAVLGRKHRTTNQSQHRVRPRPLVHRNH